MGFLTSFCSYVERASCLWLDMKAPQYPGDEYEHGSFCNMDTRANPSSKAIVKVVPLKVIFGERRDSCMIIVALEPIRVESLRDGVSVWVLTQSCQIWEDNGTFRDGLAFVCIRFHCAVRNTLTSINQRPLNDQRAACQRILQCLPRLPTGP